MRAVIKYPGNPKWKAIDTTGGESSVKALVRGNYVLWDIKDRIGVVCNERGYALGMPLCCTFRGYKLYGNVMVVGLEDGRFTDVPQFVEDRLTKMMVPAL